MIMIPNGPYSLPIKVLEDLNCQDNSYFDERWTPKIGRRTPIDLKRKRNRAAKKRANISRRRNR